jgi:hypothetical protein
MRVLLAAVFLVAGLWRAWIDWQATIGEGYAFRMSSIGTVLEATWPERYAAFTEGWQARGLLWDPVGATLMALPLALMLLVVAALLWVTRRRTSRRR